MKSDGLRNCRYRCRVDVCLSSFVVVKLVILIMRDASRTDARNSLGAMPVYVRPRLKLP